MHVVYTECFKHTPKSYQCVPSAHIEWQIHQNIIILSEFLVSYYNGSIVKSCMSDCREHVQQNAWTFCVYVLTFDSVVHGIHCDHLAHASFHESITEL